MIHAAVERDGRGCACKGCKIHKGACPLSVLSHDIEIEKFLTPHHGEKGPSDHHLSNIRAFCWPCNRAAGGSTQHREREKNIAQGIGEPPESADEVARRINEMNETAEPAFREFVIEQIQKFGRRPVDKVLDYLKPSELVYAGSEWTGANPKTCYPYLARMTNKINGFIDIAKHKPTNRRYLTFRHDDLWEMEIKEIMKLYPKGGKMYRAKPAPQKELKAT